MIRGTHRPAAGGAKVYADMEFWREILRRVLTGEISKGVACMEYEDHWKTLVMPVSRPARIV
jgi:hypothetical protein